MSKGIGYLQTGVCIIGAGPAGLMAGIYSAYAGSEVIIVEGNTTAGRKLLCSGGGRCNFTHMGSADEIARAFGKKGRFLSYGLHEYGPEKVREFFRKLGVESKVEGDGCVFPVSGKASDIRDGLVECAKENGVKFRFSKKVKRIERDGDLFEVHTVREIIIAKKVIIATGGVSWPRTGSTGDGYEFARQMGHKVVEARASLVPMVTHEKWMRGLEGLSIREVKMSAVAGGKRVTASGPMIFTDDGIGGPAALDLSRELTDYLSGKSTIEVRIDMVPGASEAEADKRIREVISHNPKKSVANIMSVFLPRRAAWVLCRQFDLGGEISGSELKREMRRRMVRMLKELRILVVGTRAIEEATVTRGGVSVEEIDSKTMGSKICRGLYFAGEVIDADGPCGGYNLQMCWSTGAVAGRSSCWRERDYC